MVVWGQSSKTVISLSFIVGIKPVIYHNKGLFCPRPCGLYAYVIKSISQNIYIKIIFFTFFNKDF